MIGRHLEAVPDHAGHQRLGLAFVQAFFDDHVAGQDHAHKARVVTQLLKAMGDELVNVAVVVGQQDPWLHMAPVATGVVHQAAQREVHAGGVEQRQRQIVGIAPVPQAIGDIVGGSRQVGAGEHPRQGGGGDAGAGQFIALLDHVRVGDVLLADADFHGHRVVVHKGPQLVEQVAAEGFRLGHGDAVGASDLDLAIGTGGGRDFAVAVVGQAQGWVAVQGALFGVRFGAVLEVTLEGLTEGTGGLFMQGRQTVDGLFGGINDYKRLAHAGLPVFCHACSHLALLR
ncbi:hypothetical protein PS623_03531 [Pseudomonas fluorescens]|nr:hypothetical protein PS623_03531 [Pseudomonas fluorescens]